MKISAQYVELAASDAAADKIISVNPKDYWNIFQQDGTYSTSRGSKFIRIPLLPYQTPSNEVLSLIGQSFEIAAKHITPNTQEVYLVIGTPLMDVVEDKMTGESYISRYQFKLGIALREKI